MKAIVKTPYFDKKLYKTGDEVEVKKINPLLHIPIKGEPKKAEPEKVEPVAEPVEEPVEAPKPVKASRRRSKK